MIDFSQIFGGGAATLSGGSGQGMGDFSPRDATQLGDFSPRSAGGSSIGTGDLLGLGGAAASLIGGFAAASGATAAGKAKAQAYTDNALSAGFTAANTMRSLTRSQLQSDYNENRLIGKQRALYGAAGVDPYSGSPLDVLGDTENQFKFEAMNRFYQGQEAATTADQQATYDTQAATAAKKEGKTNATNDIIGGIGTAASMAAKFLPFFL